MNSKINDVLLTSSRSFDALRPLKSIINNYNHAIARENLKHYPQVAVFAFDHIGLCINAEGRYENQYLCLVRRFLEQKIPFSQRKVALDIGSNIGNHSIFFSNFFEEVYAYEPNPRTFALLEINGKYWSRNNNIYCRNYGLSDKDASVHLRINHANLGGSSIVVESVDSVGSEVVLIDVKQADQISELRKKDIALIKIDIEGHELQALKGAEQLLKKNRPIILFEQGAGEIDSGTSPTIRYLERLNYRFVSIKRNFYFGEKVFLKLMSFILRSILGTQFRLVMTESFDKKYYGMILAIPDAKKSSSKPTAT